MFRKHTQYVRKVNELPFSLEERSKLCRSVTVECQDRAQYLILAKIHSHILSSIMQQ